MNNLVATVDELMTLEMRRIVGRIVAKLAFEFAVRVVTHCVPL